MTIRSDTPAALAARLREMVCDRHASDAECVDADCDARANLASQMVFNAPTIIRLLEAVDGAEKALEGLAGAEALKEVPSIVTGWNGPPEKPYAPHPSNLGANIRTTCGRVYKLNEALTAATSALATLRAAREMKP